MNFDCSCFWYVTFNHLTLNLLAEYFHHYRVRDKFALINAMSVDPLYLQHKHAQKAVDYRVSKPDFSQKNDLKSLIIFYSIGVLH